LCNQPDCHPYYSQRLGREEKAVGGDYRLTAEDEGEVADESANVFVLQEHQPLIFIALMRMTSDLSNSLSVPAEY